jgi:hypothetical protein
LVEIDPTAGLIDQETPVLLVPATVAANCWVWDAVKLAAVGPRVIETTGGGALFTDTEIVAVARLPLTARTVAERLCTPLVIDVLFQITEYGAVVTSAPIGAPSTKNWTPATVAAPTVVALRLTLPLSTAPLMGLLIAIPTGDEPGPPWPFRIAGRAARRIIVGTA